MILRLKKADFKILKYSADINIITNSFSADPTMTFTKHSKAKSRQPHV